MLKDVGMTVPKSRETRAVYIYAATRPCNNCNPKLKDVGRVTHVIIIARTLIDGLQLHSTCASNIICLLLSIGNNEQKKANLAVYNLKRSRRDNIVLCNLSTNVASLWQYVFKYGDSESHAMLLAGWWSWVCN